MVLNCRLLGFPNKNIRHKNRVVNIYINLGFGRGNFTVHIIKMMWLPFKYHHQLSCSSFLHIVFIDDWSSPPHYQI